MVSPDNTRLQKSLHPPLQDSGRLARTHFRLYAWIRSGVQARASRFETDVLIQRILRCSDKHPCKLRRPGSPTDQQVARLSPTPWQSWAPVWTWRRTCPNHRSGSIAHPVRRRSCLEPIHGFWAAPGPHENEISRNRTRDVAKHDRFILPGQAMLFGYRR